MIFVELDSKGRKTPNGYDGGGRMRAYVYGSEVAILDFYLARMHGTPYCIVRILESELVEKVPTSCIEIRR